MTWQRPVLGGKLFAKVRAKGSGPVSSGVAAVGELLSGRGGEGERIDRDPESGLLGHGSRSGDPRYRRSCCWRRRSVASPRDRLGWLGIGDAENMPIMQQLADALGAELGASRPVIDNGWLPRDRQIGSSGQTVTPKLYFAAGISGAIQHLVGMKGSQVIVAVNKDAGAPIFNVAHYGIVGDLHEVVPAVTAALKEATGD